MINNLFTYRHLVHLVELTARFTVFSDGRPIHYNQVERVLPLLRRCTLALGECRIFVISPVLLTVRLVLRSVLGVVLQRQETRDKRQEEKIEMRN